MHCLHFHQLNKEVFTILWVMLTRRWDNLCQANEPLKLQSLQESIGMRHKFWGDKKTWPFTSFNLIKAYWLSEMMSHSLMNGRYLSSNVPWVSVGASAVYVIRNLLFFQLRSLLIKESLAFSILTSSPTQKTSHAAWDK